MTIWPAYQHFEEDTKGSIEVGKLADLVILSEDPTAVDPETLDQIKVLETIKEGAVIYAATDEEQRRGDLMLRPRQNGDDPFARFLYAAVIDRELRRLPIERRTSATRALFSAAPHSISCLLGPLADLASATPGTRATAKPNG